MKNKFILLLMFILFNGFTTFGQVTEVVGNLSQPWGIFLDGNDLYIAENGKDQIIKLEIDAPMDGVEKVVDGLGGASGVILIDSLLYIGQRKDNIVSSFDINGENTKAKYVTDLASAPVGFAIDGDNLYIATRDGNRVLRLDLSTKSEKTIVRDLTFSYDVVLHGNYLFISEDKRVSKIDLTLDDPKPVAVLNNLNTPIGLLIHGDELYVAEFSANQVLKINVVKENAVATKVATGLGGPISMAISNDELYISEYNTGTISKVKIDVPSKVDDIHSDVTLVFPNPTQDYIYFKDALIENKFKIFNTNGINILEGVIQNNQIDIRHLSIGTYFISRPENKTIQFIKK